MLLCPTTAKIVFSKMEPIWWHIESDPGVFTLLVREFGVRGVQVEELQGLDNKILENLRPIHGLIFCYNYSEHEEPSSTVVTDPERLKTIYFAKQVVNNASASQAVINLLLNCNHSDVLLGPLLSGLKESSMPFDPQKRGLTLSKSQRIRFSHNCMSGIFDDSCAINKEEGAFHFNGYMPIHGRLYELDGLRDGPIDHGPIAPEQDWLDVVRPIILKRCSKIWYLNGVFKCHFNLMALVSDREMVLTRKMHELVDHPSMSEDEINKELFILHMLREKEGMKMKRYRHEMSLRKLEAILDVCSQLSTIF